MKSVRTTPGEKGGSPFPARLYPASSRAEPLIRHSFLNQGLTRPAMVLILVGFLLIPGMISGPAADRFGDIAVSPQSTISGITRQGYFEHQLLVSNDSAKRSHDVTIVFPSSSASPPGFYLRSMKRTLTVGPNSTVVFKMWQPAFQTIDKQYAVYVDGDYEGVVGSGSYVDHGRSNPGPSYTPKAQSIFTSRNVNSDQVRNLLDNLAGVPFSPAKATGAPNSTGNPGEAWKPSPRRGTIEWLELDFSKPFPAHQVIIHESEQFGAVDRLQLISASGNVIVETRHISQTNAPSLQSEAHFPLTSEPVARVKLLLYPSSPGTAQGIDAVELVGPGERTWAATARASSSMPPSPVFTGARSGFVRSRAAAAAAPGPSVNIEIVRSEFDSAQWSDQWLSYTPYDVILITPQDYEMMPEPVRGALWGYIECGGRLAVFGHIPIPSPWQKYGKRAANATTYPVGFGLCQLNEISNLDTASPNQLESLSHLINPAFRILEGPGDASQTMGNRGFQVVETARIPFRGLAMILLGFVTMAGPVNLWLLSRYKRRIWSLWTIPAISLVTCGLVSVYVIIGEGVTPHLRVEGVTLLNQTQHHAATLGLAGYYCPLTPGDGLLFDYHTELSLISDDPMPRERKAVDIDWTQGQHLQRGWIAPRVPTYFRVRKLQPRRERVHLERDDKGQLTAINGLGAPIAALRLTHLDGRSFWATNLAPGQRLVLRPVNTGGPGSSSAGATAQPGASFSPLQRLQRLALYAPSESVWEELSGWELPPGTYLALLPDTPFLEEGLRKKALRRKSQVVIGLMDSSDIAP